MNFRNILKNTIRFFEKEKLEYALIGAFALKAYGYVRATRDIDFIVEIDARPKIIPFLESLGYETLHVSEGYSNHLHPLANLGRIDFVYVQGETAEKIFGMSRKLLVLDDLRIPVACPEHIAALKIYAIKCNPDRKFRDFADIKELIELTELEQKDTKKYFEKYGMPEKYDEFAE
jgi:hypothetical protein